jgi:hypothetical protein
MLKYVLIGMLLATTASAAELRLGEAWFPKLNALCDAARYGNRMMADQVCAELAQLAQKSVAEEAAEAKKTAEEGAKRDQPQTEEKK